MNPRCTTATTSHFEFVAVHSATLVRRVKCQESRPIATSFRQRERLGKDSERRGFDVTVCRRHLHWAIPSFCRTYTQDCWQDIVSETITKHQQLCFWTSFLCVNLHVECALFIILCRLLCLNLDRFVYGTRSSLRL